MSDENQTTPIPPWKLPPNHPVNIAIDRNIQREVIRVLSSQVQDLMERVALLENQP